MRYTVAPVASDSRSLNCSGLRSDHAGNSLSGLIDVGRGQAATYETVWLSSADTGQWCHLSISQQFSANRGQHENRDLPVGLLLVFGVVRPGLDRTLPPGGFLVAEHLARLVVTC